MIVTAWNDGSHHTTGAGYGIKLDAEDRDQFFQRSWKSVFVLLPDSQHEVEINVAKPSFWNKTCRELISKDIGAWMIQKGYAPWASQNPPKFELTPLHDNYFKLNPKR